MTPLRFGVIGCGKIAPTHCEALKSVAGARLAAVYDVVQSKACSIGERYDAPAPRDWDDFLSRIDVAVVCTPSGLHADVGIRAAEAGKHVLVEKPIDVTTAAASRLVTRCAELGVRLGCISQHRFAAPMQRLKRAIESGELGQILQGDATIKWYRTQEYYDSGDWRGTYALDGGGCLMNQGVHYVDMIQWLMGGVASVQAMCRTLNHQIEVEDTAMALVEYRNGAVGVIRGSTCCYPELAERLDVHGTYGTVILERDRPKLWHTDPVGASEGQYGGGVMMQPTPAAVLEAPCEADDPTCAWGEQHRLQLEDFATAIHEGREPFLTGADALEPLKVILAIYESSRRGGERVTLA